MNLLVLLIIGLLTTWEAAAVTDAPALNRLEQVPVFGRSYIRLSQWSAAEKLEFKWIKKDEEALLVSKWARLTFKADSRRTEINGICVWLSFPIARKNGEFYITPTDLQTAIMPVLHPPRNSKTQQVKTICIDPGHGGKDPGNLKDDHLEKKLTLQLALELQRQLQTAGLKVILTRSTDIYVNPFDRPDIARQKRADLYLSLHFNAIDASEVKGVETYCMTPAYASSSNARGEGGETGPRPGNQNDSKNMLLAYQIHKSVVRSLETEDRGVRRARFAVLNVAQMPATLIEGGYMTSDGEKDKIFDPAYRIQMARAITDGILAYKRLMERGIGKAK